MIYCIYICSKFNINAFTNMNNRLQSFIAAENLTQSQFADNINVARASISHILSGRNKPGFDFVEKLMKAFPNLNIEWLITGKGKMYKTAQSGDDNLFPDYGISDSVPAAEENDILEIATPLLPAKNNSSKLSEATTKQGKSINNQKNISRIIVFFDDNSFQEFK